jgi:hypothetical protein
LCLWGAFGPLQACSGPHFGLFRKNFKKFLPWKSRFDVKIKVAARKSILKLEFGFFPVNWAAISVCSGCGQDISDESTRRVQFSLRQRHFSGSLGPPFGVGMASARFGNVRVQFFGFQYLFLLFSYMPSGA